MITTIYYIVLIILLVYFIAAFFKRTEATGSWSHLFKDMAIDPEGFYNSVESALKEREVPDIKVDRVTIKEGGMLSHTRVYMEVKRKDYVFHICACPWGKGFFFSWWVREKLDSVNEILIKIPIIGKPLVDIRLHASYYKLDTDKMFRSSVHQSVVEAIDGITEEQGVRGLSELERVPTLKDKK